MSVPNIGPFIKRLYDGVGRGDVYIIFIILAVGFGSFGLGRLSKIKEAESLPVTIYSDTAVGSSTLPIESSSTPAIKEVSVTNPSTATKGQGLLVGSKNSNKYHFPWCSGALRIKDENKIWFASYEEARAKGYTPASNCKGLE